jgi:hypothetical protein
MGRLRKSTDRLSRVRDNRGYEPSLISLEIQQEILKQYARIRESLSNLDLAVITVPLFSGAAAWHNLFIVCAVGTPHYLSIIFYYLLSLCFYEDRFIPFTFYLIYIPHTMNQQPKHT